MPINKYLPAVTPTDGLARLGKLHKGTPKQERTKNGETYQIVGKDLEYFRVAFAGEYEWLEPSFTALYGEKPTQIPFQVNADKALEAFDFWNEDYDSKGTLLHRCDGSKQAVSYNKSTGYHESNLPCVYGSGVGACSCKQVGRLTLYLPDFLDATGVLGTITLETHSDHDIRTIIARLTSYQLMFGTLRGVPLILLRVPKEVSAPKTDKQGKRTGERTKINRAMIDIQVSPDFTKTRIRAAINGQFNSERAVLPHTINAVVPQEDAQQALSSGPHRIAAPALPSTPAPALPAVSTPDPTLAPGPHWTTDKASWDGFIKWAALYGVSGMKAMDALEEAALSAIEEPTDWKADKTHAMGAVIANVCDYKPEKIDKYTIKGLPDKEPLTDKTQAAIRAAAQEITEARHNALLSNAAAAPAAVVESDADAEAAAAKDLTDTPES